MWKLLPEEYLYHKGGGNNAMIYMMMQMQKQADEAKAEQRRLDAEAKEAARVAKAEEDQKLADSKVTSANKVGAAYENALSSGKAKLANKGIDIVNDPYGIMCIDRKSVV